MSEPVPAAQKAALDSVLADVAAAPGIVVFDLDDTVFSTNDRHLRILREYSDLIAARDPEASAVLRAIARESLHYQIVQTAAAAGVDEAVTKDLRDFWFARFFQNRYLLEDTPVPGAPAFCAEVLSRGGTVVYVTGRDERMREGTEKSFVNHGFPQPDGKSVLLMLKPKFDTPDHAFKSETLAVLGELGRVAASFENEPTHINMFRDAFPKGKHFLLETKHSGRPVIPHADVVRIKDFRR
ncbi:MAG TPA: HAD family acid phosphatase [Elusimicrobiota bacterium]|nr:HAD family acid phosphatase [Elusimicrobiota bacterium]